MKKLFFGLFFIFLSLFFFNGCAGLSVKKPMANKLLSLSQNYRTKALGYENTGELQKALYYWKIAGDLNPGDEEIVQKLITLRKKAQNKAERHFKKGLSYYKMDNSQKARKEFLTALRYHPGHKKALDFLKNKLRAKNYFIYKVKKNDTLKKIAHRVYKDPGKDFFIAYFNNLDILKKPATGTYLKLPIIGVELTKPLFDIDNELIKAKDLFSKKKYEKALSITTKILGYDPTNVHASNLENACYYQMGIRLNVQEKYSESLITLENADPGYKDVKEKISEIKKKMETKAADRENASLYKLGKKLKMQKKFVESLKILKKVDLKYKNVKQVISEVEKIIVKQTETHYRTGVKYFVNEKLKLAIEEWEKTLALDPSHKKAKKNIENAQSLLEKLEKIQ